MKKYRKHKPQIEIPPEPASIKIQEPAPVKIEEQPVEKYEIPEENLEENLVESEEKTEEVGR